MTHRTTGVFLIIVVALMLLAAQLECNFGMPPESTSEPMPTLRIDPTPDYSKD